LQKTSQNTTKHNKQEKEHNTQNTINKKKEQNCKNFEKKIPSLTFRLEDHVHGHLPRRKKTPAHKHFNFVGSHQTRKNKKTQFKTIDLSFFFKNFILLVVVFSARIKKQLIIL
jgi:hypothetical protein